MAKRPSKQRLVALALIIGLLLAVTIAGVYFAGPLLELLQDPMKAREFIEQFGVWGWAIFVLAMTAQVLIAPIPGQVAGFLGGLLFGAFWGTVLTMIGAAIGFTIIFWLARKLGRPFVEYFVDAKTLKRFDHLAESKGPWVFFWIFLLPAFPDDIICYIAGLTNIKIRTLIIISLLGRLPGYIVLSLAGSGVAESQWQLLAAIIVPSLTISAVAYWQRDRLERFANKFIRK